MLVACSMASAAICPGFVSQREAQRWIEDKAPAWFSHRSKAPRASLGHPARRTLGGSYGIISAAP